MAPPSTRNFQWEKLRLALWIQSIGMAIALAWHGWQGWVLGKGYPENTFLFRYQVRFTDFYYVVDLCRYSNPYDDRLACYFPFSYVLFKPFTWLPHFEGVLIFLTACGLGLAALLFFVLRPAVRNPYGRFVLALLLPALSYPVLLDIDRGNIEIMMVLLAGWMVYFSKRRQFGLAVLFLIPAICLKLYPAMLLLLLLRRRQLPDFILALVASTVITLICFASLAYSIPVNWHKWQANMQTFHQLYIIGNNGLAGSASPWNGFKVLAVLGPGFIDPTRGFSSLEQLIAYLESAYSFYTATSLIIAALLVLHVLFVEREFQRRAVVLLIFLTLIAPGAGDYRMLYACAGLVGLVVLPTRRPGDLWATALLAFTFIPKREVLLRFLGHSDSGASDISIAIFLNPLCMIAAVLFLVWAGWKARIPGWGWRRLRGLLNFRHLPFLGRRTSHS